MNIVLLLCLCLFTIVTAQNSSSDIPHCAVICAQSIPDATDPTFLCTNTTLQAEVGACVKKACSVKEGLISQNATATGCSWPDRNRASSLKNVAIILFAFATTAVAARIISRIPHYGGALGFDDYVILLVWILMICFTVLICVVSTTGLGRDIWTVPFNDITLTLEYFNILTYIYICLTWLTKVSILLLYLRLFPDVTFRNIVKGMIVSFGIIWVGFLLGSILRCQPVSYAWKFWDGEHQGTCPDILVSAQGWPHVAFNISADLIVLLLPLPTISRLNLPLEKKLSVMFMLSTGIFVTAVSIYRATTFRHLVASTNFTWDWLEAGMWSAIETYVGVICACMPGMRAFTRQVFPGNRWREQDPRMRTKSSFNKSTSSDPSTVGTIGSRTSAVKMPRREDEFELISLNGEESGPGPAYRNETEHQ